ncbi:hypothetical protein FOZ61_010184 [Perkinsus olseni]|uniref:Uncharacterized protein n=1 Tax=Perkinsus olseni TaxID=32597 RepID=A0A7J6MWG0_PEROL|nr:hypothetical protein FOZ61_010184 [Perkinsus olseni]KAF4675959.1 hypothetical protein FOL46_008570 [Perkinsus olseni]
MDRMTSMSTERLIKAVRSDATGEEPSGISLSYVLCWWLLGCPVDGIGNNRDEKTKLYRRANKCYDEICGYMEWPEYAYDLIAKTYKDLQAIPDYLHIFFILNRPCSARSGQSPPLWYSISNGTHKPLLRQLIRPPVRHDPVPFGFTEEMNKVVEYHKESWAGDALEAAVAFVLVELGDSPKESLKRSYFYNSSFIGKQFLPTSLVSCRSGSDCWHPGRNSREIRRILRRGPRLTMRKFKDGVRYAWINRVEDKTMKQTRYSAALIANETEDCFTSLSPPDLQVVADLNRICANHDFWITTSSDPMHIEDGTYSGERADSMKLKVDVKDGRAERVTARPKNEGAKTMKKLTYFKVGDVLSVTMKNPAASLIRDKMILEPNTRDAQFEHGVGRSNLKDWDRETASAANMERGKGKAAKGGLKALKKLARKLTRREKHQPT